MATTYYISNSGNDASIGTSSITAWKTIAKINASMGAYQPGDSILFNKGDTFYGTININSTGNAGNPITYSYYGSGTNPIITGLTSITSGWTSVDGSVYYKNISPESSCNFIMIDGSQYAMGRYPKGYNFIIDSHSTNVSITDASIDSSINNWTGAEAVIRKNEFIEDRCKITNHSSHTLTYIDTENVDDATDGYYYFIQNDIRTLTQFGDWYYDGTKLYMYFGANTPTNHVINVPTLDTLLYSDFYFLYITVDGLSFKGANYRAIYYRNSHYGIVKNCNVDFVGSDGIWMASDYSLVDNNFINYVSQRGIYNAGNGTVTNNTIKNIGTIEGIGITATRANGIEIQGSNSLIQYNVIDYVGYDGIKFGASGAIGVSVKNNLISNFGLCLNDVGGIYTNGDFNNHTFNSESVIDNNIIFNGIGKKGISSYNLIAQGIYMDSYSSGIAVTNNTVYSCSGFGIMLSNGNNVTIQNNTCYDNVASMYFLEWGGADVVNNIVMTDNIFFAKKATDITLEFESQSGTIGSFGTSDRNYYARPIDDNSTIYTYEGGIPSSVYRTLTNWQSYTSQDANSHKSPKAEDNFYLQTNPTDASIIVSLAMPYIDVKNTVYTNSLTLAPWSSIILMPSAYFLKYNNKFIMYLGKYMRI